MEAEIEGLPITTNVLVLGQISLAEDVKPIKALYGALAMREWGLVMTAHEQLDLRNYPGEFVKR